jgi:hypothetical protein
MEPSTYSATDTAKFLTRERTAQISLVAIGIVSVVLFQAYRLFERALLLHPSVSLVAFALVVAVCLATSRITYVSVPPALTTLMRCLGMACGAYSILLFPSIPAVAHNFGGLSEIVLGGAWLAAGIAALLALRRPSWLLLSGFYIFWVKNIAGYITGLPFTTMLDVLPLIQLPIYLAISVVALEFMKSNRFALLSRLGEKLQEAEAAPYMVILLIGIAMQAANYFYSSLAKGGLDGGLFDWILSNENQNIFHIALYNKQLLWGEWSELANLVTAVLHFAGRPVAISIFAIQLAALVVFANRRLLLVLFACFDLMHVGIFVLVGANFWTWFMVNVSIIAAVSRLPSVMFNWKVGVAGASAILLSPLFADVAKLGWYDSLAINSAYFAVVQSNGHVARVPSTVFGFYSYPIAHMSFGLPPGKYLPTLTNGGTYSAAILRQSYRCDFDLSTSPFEGKWDGNKVGAYIKGWHHQILGKVGADGHFSNRLYPHHFWSAPSVETAFSQVDMRQVSAYIMMVDSVCLEPESGALKRKVYHNEFRIDIGE